MAPIISLEDVSFNYKGSKRRALDGVSLEVEPGECVAILGSTGAGKSTLACVMNGTIPRFIDGDLSGKVVVDGMVPSVVGTARMATRVGLVFGDPDVQLFGMTVEEDVAFGPSNLGLDYSGIMDRVDKAISAMRLKGLESRAPHRLSGGQKQATAIAGVYAMLPKIMVLDEPTSMLDPEGKARVFASVRHLKESLGVTVVLIEQEVDDILALADRVFVMKGGKFVLSGRPREVFAHVDEIRAAGVRVPQIVEFGRLIGGEEPPFTVDEAVSLVSRGAWGPPGWAESVQLNGRADAQAEKPAGSTSFLRGPRPVLETVDLEFRYPMGTKALNGVTLTIHEGEFVAIVGQNGAGKTTLTRHFNGLLRPTSGQIEVLGKPSKGIPTTELCREVGYVFQNPDEQLFCTTVEDELRFGPTNIGLSPGQIDAVTERILCDIGLAKYRDVWPKYLTKGERQRLALGSVVAMGPKILIVDEPTTGLDWVESLQILDYLERLRREHGMTIVIITHDMNIVSLYAKRVIVMAKGRVVGDGTPKEVFSRPDLMEQASLRRPPIADLSNAIWGEVILTPEEAAQRLLASREGASARRCASSDCGV
ncbi:MAG: energy-coupling factor transporter ATPase [Firmicutes bacterium]|nr:energy-coupling factor transporter ATPase [Bacillota bacterium]